MNVEIKNRLTQLVEINRALVQDLDVSHRIIADLGSERDRALESTGDLESRSSRAEEQARVLHERLTVVVEERDNAWSRLDEMTSVMDEIHRRLLLLPAEELHQDLPYGNDSDILFE